MHQSITAQSVTKLSEVKSLALMKRQIQKCLFIKTCSRKGSIISSSIITNDSDVVIIAISFFCDLKLLGLGTTMGVLWIGI